MADIEEIGIAVAEGLSTAIDTAVDDGLRIAGEKVREVCNKVENTGKGIQGCAHNGDNHLQKEWFGLIGNYVVDPLNHYMIDPVETVIDKVGGLLTDAGKMMHRTVDKILNIDADNAAKLHD
ncbi:hypothetical protein [Segniliparus rugosus]|uniref:Uncharacterized protein n=1 Tax=Segniliparus rugosus (strain ATCC BAA-974 / DSM 45345 / CCUG 50838 / CIP 108380 / JCM 13579 / CDC 945) TaxID=679197 RepID=U1LN52_SEGRC|nr:hypothetical protein [Segniliparus rugosus]ERG69371.1 hypothetical protein HMPREF9336_04067 [Segniliparus rugosus ATCC BAA-974]